MAHKKQGGKTSQHVSPAGKRLGPKVNDGQKVGSGEVLVRQRGSNFKSSKGTSLARDFTIYSLIAGVVKFGRKFGRKIISVN